MMKKLIRKVKEVYASQPTQQGDRQGQIMKVLDEGLGHLRSYEEKKPVDVNGQPLPWFTYPAIEYLQQLDLREVNMLEWGIGNSTRFFAARCKSIYSIEHDKEWYDKISGTLPGNASTVLANPAEYAKIPLGMGMKYDVIIVDGINRAECIDVAMEVVQENGLVIFDNADRNPELCKLLRDQQYLQVDFHGLGPINGYSWTTSLFFSRKNQLQPLSIQPTIPAGGGY